MSEQQTKEKANTQGKSVKARNTAVKIVLEKYQDEFNAIHDEERRKLGLFPVKQKTLSKHELMERLQEQDDLIKQLREKLGESLSTDNHV